LIDITMKENWVPLLTWRLKRKFTELKKIVDEAVIENVSMLRFCSLGTKDKWELSSLLYRELDLCEFIGNGQIVSLQTVISEERSGNVILRLDNNILCSIEISTCIPSIPGLVDRHEIIARRGVASDLIVDTMIPQNSIVSFTGNGEHRYRDVDMELFGFSELEIDQIRSAFQVLKQPELITQWQFQHQRLVSLVHSVLESGKKISRTLTSNAKII